MAETIIARGAEAVITKTGNTITKTRIEKSYRYPQLDQKIRKLRTRSEAKILEKIFNIIPSPKIISSDEKNSTIEMKYILGKKLSDNLDKMKDYQKICKKIGENLAKIHDSNIIHGDLTTSNMILGKDNKVYFIDYGLSFNSPRIEDRAVDLHLIKQALEAKHPSISEIAFKSVIEGYQKSKNAKRTIEQLEKVEKRGRYKAQY